MIDISIILPVYNRENYLRKTLISIENQTFKNFEVIVIDDGSTDSSFMISKEFCEKNTNWKLLRIDHRGVSHARIHGINNSKGRYLSFIDSDDYVEPNFLEVLYKNIGNSQIAMCNYRTIYGESNFGFVSIWYHRSGIFKRDSILKSLIVDFSVKSFLWNKLFDRSLFDDIFIPEMCFEDKIMCLQLFYKIESCSIVNKILYNYHKNQTSMTWEMDEKLLSDYIKFSEFLKDFLSSKNEYKKFRNSHKIYSIHVFSLIFRVIFFNCAFKDKSFKNFFKKLFYNYKRLIESLKS